MEFLDPLLAATFLGKAAWIWVLFLGIVAALLVFDLGVLHRTHREIGVRESLWLSAGYVGVAMAFGGWMWWYLGPESGIQFLTGFLVEKSLSLDNVFVIALIFSFFAIPRLSFVTGARCGGGPPPLLEEAAGLGVLVDRPRAAPGGRRRAADRLRHGPHARLNRAAPRPVVPADPPD